MAENTETVIENVEVEMNLVTLGKIVGVVVLGNGITELAKYTIRKIRHGRRMIIKAPEADILLD